MMVLKASEGLSSFQVWPECGSFGNIDGVIIPLTFCEYDSNA